MRAVTYIVASERRDLSRHRTRKEALERAARHVRSGRHKVLDVYGVEDETPLDPAGGIGYRIDEMYEVRRRGRRVTARRYLADGSPVGKEIKI